MTELLQPPSEHNHDPESQEELDKDRARTSVKRKAEEDLLGSSGKIACEVASRYTTLNYKHVDALSQAVKRVRATQRPALPKTAQDVHSVMASLNDPSLETITNDAENNLIIISSIQNLRYLAESSTVLGDGTFKHCPKHFYQLYTIHAHGSNNLYVPCVFCLLKDKKQTTYELMLVSLRDTMASKGLSFAPDNFHVDFEVSMHNAIKNTLTGTTIQGCQFHLGQAWFRQIQQLGLSVHYTDNNSELGKVLKCFFALPALNPSEISAAFSELTSLQQDNDAYDSFKKYVSSTYIKPFSLFPPVLWAGLEVVNTTNACESFHRHLASIVKVAHPNIYLFLDALRQQQTMSILKIRSGECAVPLRPSRLKKELKKKKAMDRLRAGHSSLLEFLQEACFSMLPPRL